MRAASLATALALATVAAQVTPAPRVTYDVLIQGGIVYDGAGGPGRRADVGLRGDTVVAVGDLSSARGNVIVDASGLAVTPGFINMLSWSTETLIADGRSQGEIRQGVTTEIFGEGVSMGPVSDRIRERMLADQADIRFDIPWTSLAGYLAYLEARGVAPNVASFLGATTVREYVLGLEDRRPSAAQLDQMRALVAQAMEEGALGIGSSLIYAPASYSTTEELIELCKVAARYKGRYISHLRSEGDRLLQAVDELIRVSREAGLPAEIYHLKAAGQPNWPKMDAVIARVEEARRQGLEITADMYTYTAGATGFDACVPRWALEGGIPALVRRIGEAATRGRIVREMRTTGMGFENLCLAAGSPERILLVGFKTGALKLFTGKTLAEVAHLRGKDPWETILDLIAEDGTRINVVFFLMSEENVRKEIALPWVSFGSDAGSMAPEGAFLRSSTHPRAYGNFARLLGKYVREEKRIPLEEAVRRLSGLPAENLGLDRRGLLQEGMFADVVVFDPATVADRATYDDPHRYAVGVRHVFVNGVQVLKDGEHTGALPGRALKGQGATAAKP
jgi:N-acyl-D-amino-acid deacylase